MNGTETQPKDYAVTAGVSRTIPNPIPPLAPEPSKLIIELTNLNEGSMKTIKRDLKTLIEDYAWKKMISGNINVTEEE